MQRAGRQLTWTSVIILICGCANAPALLVPAQITQTPGGHDSSGDPAGESVVLDRDRDGFPDNFDGCPDVPGLKPDGCPVKDRDGDGLLDMVDRCPDDPGVEPDGCPIPDTDGDGVLDPDDGCPTQPETRQGFLDGDGCPDGGGKLDLDPQLKIQLHRQAATMRDNPKLNLEMRSRSVEVLHAAWNYLVRTQDIASTRIRPLHVKEGAITNSRADFRLYELSSELITIPKASDASASEFAALIRTALEKFEAKDYVGAVALLERAYASQPTASILYDLGRIYEEGNNVDAAIAYYEKFITEETVSVMLRERALQRLSVLNKIVEIRKKEEARHRPQR